MPASRPLHTSNTNRLVKVKLPHHLRYAKAHPDELLASMLLFRIIVPWYIFPHLSILGMVRPLLPPYPCEKKEIKIEIKELTPEEIYNWDASLLLDIHREERSVHSKRFVES